jgi:hypothetical protein
MCTFRELADAGCLMAYGPSVPASFRRAALARRPGPTSADPGLLDVWPRNGVNATAGRRSPAIGMDAAGNIAL